MDATEAAEQFERTYGAARMNLEGVGEELALRTPGEEGNSINWIVGHIVAYRHRLLEELGPEISSDSEALKQYAPEGEGSWAPERAVPLERLSGLLVASQKSLSTELGSVGSRNVDGSPGTPDFSFYQFHEAYHVGQIALARRCLGLPGVISPSDAPPGNA